MEPKQNFIRLDGTDYGIDCSRPLGQGSLGLVFLGCKYHINSDDIMMKVAIKYVSQESVDNALNDTTKYSVTREMAFAQENRQHKNVLSYLDLLQTVDQYIIVSEYCEWDLAKQLRNEKRFNEDEAMTVFCDIIEGYSYLRSFNIIHRDLKPQNILCKNGTYKIGDLGSSRNCESTENGDPMSALVGSMFYMSPEMLADKIYDEKTDIWSLGVILYEMLYGKLPFENSYSQMSMLTNVSSFCRRLETGDKSSIFPKNIYVSDKCKDLIEKMLKFSKNDRISLQEIARHDLFQSYLQATTFNKSKSNEVANEEKKLDTIKVKEVERTWIISKDGKKTPGPQEPSYPRPMARPRKITIVNVTHEMPVVKKNKIKIVTKSNWEGQEQKPNTLKTVSKGTGVLTQDAKINFLKNVDPEISLVSPESKSSTPRRNIKFLSPENRSKSWRALPTTNNNNNKNENDKNETKSYYSNDQSPNIQIIEDSADRKQERRLRCLGALEEYLEFNLVLIREMERLIRVFLGMSQRVKISEDNDGFMSCLNMLAFALSKFCYIQYKTEVAPLVVDRQQIFSEKNQYRLEIEEWKDCVESEGFLALVKKYDTMKKISERFNHFYSNNREMYENLKQTLSLFKPFFSIRNDKIDDMGRVKGFLGEVGKEIVKRWYKHIISMTKAQVKEDRDEENKEVVLLLRLLERIKTVNVAVFPVEDLKKDVENLKSSRIQTIIREKSESWEGNK